MSPFEHLAASSGLRQKFTITAVVLLLHGAALWALQSGAPRGSEVQIITAEVIAQFIAPPSPEPPAPVSAPVTPPPPVPPPPKPKPQPPKPAPQPKPKPQPVQQPLPAAIADPTPAPDAPVGAIPDEPQALEPLEPLQPAAPAQPDTSSPPPAPAPSAPASGGEVELPSSNASYLNNPRPGYPAISRRMNEQGTVMLRVFVDANGLPQQIEIKESSGFDRLDKAAVAAVQRWRFVPGKRDGVAEGMWNNVPINFVLD